MERRDCLWRTGLGASLCTKAFFIVLCALSADTAFVQPAIGQNSPAAPKSPDAAGCEQLARLDLQELPEAPARVMTARLVDSTPAGPVARSYCRVTGYVAPQNRFELRLPLPRDWNQKFFFTLCAGFCGAVEGDACNESLSRGYASVTGNGGHESSPGFDGTWAANAPTLHEDYAYRSNHVVTLAAKAITTRYYGRPIARSYASGCSKGGHGGLIEIERFPEDFDGVIVGAPVSGWTGQLAMMVWATQAVSDAQNGSVLDSTALRVVHASVLAMCGAQAGVDEGMVTDPASCSWRPERAACRSGATTDCLSTRQVVALTKLMTPPAGANGRVLYAAAFVPGSETNWRFWYVDPSGAGSITETGHYLAATQFLRFMALPKADRTADARRANLGRIDAQLNRTRQLFEATSPNLRAFKAHGGKVILWHGLADAAIPTTSSIAYYDRVTDFMGGRATTNDFFRLFLLPGVHHCAGGPGPDVIDAIAALEAWVERGIAPEVLVAQRVRNGVVERSRPAFPYPARARYSGSGDPMRAESFVRSDPVIKP